MQSKVVLTTTAALVIVPTLLLFLSEYTEGSVQTRLFLSLFQAVTPRTAGFNTASLSSLSGPGRLLLISLMLTGGSPGSTAGGVKTTTVAVLFAGAFSVFQRKKSVQLFGRRIEESTSRNAASLLLMYLILPAVSAVVISAADHLPLGICLFETVSAIGTVGLSLGVTPSLSIFLFLILIRLMFFCRVGGLTLISAAVSIRSADVAQRPVEKIVVG
jgi:trk system potassium uptake protein TrkH